MRNFRALRSAGHSLLRGEAPAQFVRPAFLLQVGDVETENGMQYIVKKIFYLDDCALAYALLERT